MPKAAAKNRIVEIEHVHRELSANEKTRRLGERFRVIKRQIAALQKEAQEIVDMCIHSLGLGKYDHVTVYKVKSHWVARHRRAGHTAVRARMGGKREF